MKLGTTWKFRELAIYRSTLYTRISHPASKLNFFALAALCCLHNVMILPWHLETSQPAPLSFRSHPPRIPRIPLTPHSRPYTSPSSPSRLSIPCMHHARVHREHSFRIMHIHTFTTLKGQHERVPGASPRTPAPAEGFVLYPVSPIHLSTSFTHHSEKHSHTHSSLFAHTHT